METQDVIFIGGEVGLDNMFELEFSMYCLHTVRAAGQW